MTAGGDVWLGLLGAQWLLLCTALFLIVLLLESFLGDYRTGFRVWVQYSSYVFGLGIVVALGVVCAAPHAAWSGTALRITGWSSIALALVGLGFHLYYGIVKQPGGRAWLLHHLMYHAPLLAPLALAAVGAMTLIAAASLDGTTLFGLATPSRATALVVAATLIGLMLQVAVLHYRGAFNNPVMYAPLAIAIGAAGVALWRVNTPSSTSARAYEIALWAVFLLGFSGWGWHLRGLDRMMGGLYVALPNLLEGPPPNAPLLFALLAAQGIVGEKLL